MPASAFADTSEETAEMVGLCASLWRLEQPCRHCPLRHILSRGCPVLEAVQHRSRAVYRSAHGRPGQAPTRSAAGAPRSRPSSSTAPCAIHEILADPPEYLLTAKVVDVLMAAPKCGRVKSARIMEQCRISPSKTVGGLSDRQRTSCSPTSEADLIARSSSSRGLRAPGRGPSSDWSGSVSTTSPPPCRRRRARRGRARWTAASTTS